MFVNNSVIVKRFEVIAKILRQKLLVQNTIQALPWILSAAFMVYWLSLPNYYLLAVLLLVIIIRLFGLVKSRRYQKVTVENIALHLNCQYQELEESAQLLLIDDSQLSHLQILQKKRIIPRLNDVLAKKIMNYCRQLFIVQVS
jgi:hypothetical protein